jgi:hypothetical protein
VPATGVEYERVWRVPWKFTIDESTVGITGRTDICRTDGTRAIWEVKYSQSLSEESILQLAIYAALMQEQFPGEAPLAYLINARTGQAMRIIPNNKNSLKQIVSKLVENKTRTGEPGRMTDEEFFEDAKNGFKNAIGPLVLPAWFSQPTKVQPGPLPKGKKK